MYCPNCGTEIPVGYKFCFKCGTPVSGEIQEQSQPRQQSESSYISLSQQTTGYYKQPAPPQKKKKHIVRKVLVFLLCFFIFFGIVYALFSSNDSTELNTDTQSQAATQKKTETTTKAIPTTEAPTLSPSEYKKQCKSVSYEKIARNPDDYKGELVKFTGKVEQVIEHSWIPNEYRVSVTKGDYGLWEDVVYVKYTLPEGSSRILEGDIVTFYGECEGTTSYLSILGQTVTIPSVNAVILEQAQ